MDKQLMSLEDDIVNEFTNETKILFIQDLINQKKEIEKIYNQLNSIVIQQTGEKKQISKSYNSLLKNAYRIIMWSKQFFTGEVIDYRIYYATNAESSSIMKNVSVYHLTEEEILNLVTIDGTSLRLNSSFTGAIKNREHDKQREAIFDKHWIDIFKGLEESFTTKQTAYVVKKHIYNQYSAINKHLGETVNDRVSFNRGNLYESFDATATDVYRNYLQKKINNIDQIYSFGQRSFERKYFGVYLKHDSIKGFQTGDVDLTQIKARGAQLIELNTLKSYIKDILNILNMANGLKNKEKLKNKIRSMFVNPEIKKLSPELNQLINKKVDEIVKSLQKK